MPKGDFSIKIERYSIDADPSIDVFQITLKRGEGIWPETVSSEENLRWLLRGIKMMSPAGMLPEFEIPRHATKRFVPEKPEEEEE